jgi:hypothetical protein
MSDNQPENQPQPAAQNPAAPDTADIPAAAPPKRIGFLVIALVFLVVVVGVRWWFTTSQALREVFIEASSPLCTETDVVDVDLAGTPVAAPRVVSGMRCEVVVNIVNPGQSNLYLNKVVAPGIGRDSGLPIQAVEADGRTPSTDGDDATYSIDQDLEAGDLLQINIAYEFRDDGCIEGTTFSAPAWPSAQVSMARHTKTVTADRGFALRSAPESTC